MKLGKPNMRKYDEIFNDVFSEYFVGLRKSKGLTKDKVAYYLHLPKSTFNSYETGTRDCPLSVMKAVCEFYGVDFIEAFKYLDDETTKRERKKI
jgi:transcriptional regulator with XRE-family HTH domain